MLFIKSGWIWIFLKLNLLDLLKLDLLDLDLLKPELLYLLTIKSELTEDNSTGFGFAEDGSFGFTEDNSTGFSEAGSIRYGYTKAESI